MRCHTSAAPSSPFTSAAASSTVRAFEEEADLLGLQYLYKAGYDPTAFVDFFERMAAMEKRKPGTVSQLFRSHPQVASRIKTTQRSIQELLAVQPQYVVDTSEFREVTQELTRYARIRKGTPEKSGPTLRRKAGSGPISADDAEKSRPDQDERPTMKRRNP